MPGKTTARRHHFVPQAYLARFTDSGKKDGQMYVCEVETGRTFKTSPTNVALEKDFNRIDVDGHPPDLIENQLADLEGSSALAIGRVIASREFPSDEDYSHILHLIALLFVRNPRMRQVFNHTREHSIRRWADLVVSEEASLQRALASAREAGLDIPETGSHEEIRRFVASSDYKIEFHSQSNLRVELLALEAAVRSLHERTWSVIVAPDGEPDFICSDHPVSLVCKTACNGPPGLSYANTELFLPLSPRVGLYGVFEDEWPPEAHVSVEGVAILNGRVRANAWKHVFSRDPEFVIWSNQSIQTMRLGT